MQRRIAALRPGSTFAKETINSTVVDLSF